MKKLHEDTRATIEAQVHRQAEKLNKNKKPMIFKEGDLVRIHLRKERFPEERNSKLKPRGDRPYKVLKRINSVGAIACIYLDEMVGHSSMSVRPFVHLRMFYFAGDWSLALSGVGALFTVIER